MTWRGIAVGKNEYYTMQDLVQYKLNNIPDTSKEILNSITKEDWKKYSSLNKGVAAHIHTSLIKVIHYKRHSLSFEEKKREWEWPGSEYLTEEHQPFFNNNRLIRDFLLWFEHTYGGTIHRVKIVRLPQGKSVYEHIDGGTYYKNKDRFHLVLQGEYEYTVNGQEEAYKAGDLFWFDNSKPHKSTNISGCDRVSVIFDASNSKWREVVRKN